jgi:CheY-like chemotaxis protein
MQYDIRSSGVQIVKEFESDLPDVFADANQLEQVLLNLVKNGMESMQGNSREKVLKIRTWSQANNVKIEVIDHGNGIPPQVLEKIFDPSANLQEVGAGLGFGLNISFHIIKDHSGGLSARTNPAGGTIFMIELPVSTQKSTKKDKFKESAYIPPKPIKQSFDVLVVDDEVAIQDVFSELLADHSCRVHGANNGLEAMRQIEKQEFDLIISDLKMPVMDGRWLYEKVRETKPAVLKKFVFITGDTNSAKTAEFLERCGNPWLTKPFNFQDVETILMDHIRRIQREETSANK